VKKQVLLLLLTFIFTLTICGVVSAGNTSDLQNLQNSGNNEENGNSDPTSKTVTSPQDQQNNIPIPDPRNTRTGISYTTIQAALNEAEAGDEITVEAGTYPENVYITKENITLTAQGTVIIQAADPNKNTVNINANGAKINGFTITGATGHYHDAAQNLEIGYSGIRITSANNCTIINNKLIGNAIGIALSGASYNLLDKNNIAENPLCGIMIDDSSHYNKIYNNTIDNNGQGYPGVGIFEGVLIRQSYYNQLIDNNVTKSGDNGITINNAHENIIANNTVIGNGIGSTIFMRGGIKLYDSSKNNISGNIVQNNWDYGISVDDGSWENVISGNTVSDNNDYGIEIDGGVSSWWLSNNNQVLNNKITNHTRGIYTFKAVNTLITNNEVTGGTPWGIYISQSNGDKLTGNTVKNCEIGMEILNSLNIQLRNNILENNEYNFGVNAGGAFGLPNYQTLDIDKSNTVNGNPIYYIVGQNGGIFDNTMTIGYLALISCENIQVNSLQISNNLQGILLAGTNNTSVQNCKLQDNEGGINLRNNATGNTVSGNVLTNSGISLESSSNNQILNNIITQTIIGISITASDNQIIGNKISNTDMGISLFLNAHNNLLNENELTGNIIGIQLLGWKNIGHPTQNSIIGNIITGNQVGINTTNSSNEAHFNSISGNSNFGIVNTDFNSFNATNNYWGSLDDPNTLVNGLVETNPYIVLHINASPTLIPLNGQSTVTADLRYDSNGNYHDPTLEHIPDGTLVEFSTDLGSLENHGTKSIQKPTVNAITTTTLFAEGAAGEANVTGKIGTDTKQTSVNIQPSADIYVNVNVDKSNPTIGDIVQITFKVGNNHDKIAENTVLTLVIPGGLQFQSASSPDGYNNFSYDNSTRTITWNLGDLSQIDPTLVVLITVLDPGTYSIRPSITTITFDPNLEVMTGSAVIYAQSGLTSDSDPETSTTVNAAIKTVPMQTTGLPMGVAILAVLMMVTGLFNSKREK